MCFEHVTFYDVIESEKYRKKNVKDRIRTCATEVIAL
jgi:hypothetical protein